ncbi:hypothetical protein QFC19_003378 [Naganishia cerealis]|uniref:Uncharacterized protein n=1 Tax=Naganishia cerealis TaxID=610337 RepID=A0ACC2W3X0_9TREE|nr:hypothetical protein QFC19_003378 [Naganishia cerealis]
MVVKLRLARHGRKNTPFYHLVAVNASKRRDALPLEKLGEYDPIPRPSPPTTSLAAAIAQSFHLDSKGRDAAAKEVREKRIVWDVERVRWWLGVGAQPTEAVVKLLEREVAIVEWEMICLEGGERIGFTGPHPRSLRRKGDGATARLCDAIQISTGPGYFFCPEGRQPLQAL